MSGEIQKMLNEAKERLKRAKGSERDKIQEEVRALEIMLSSQRKFH